MHLITWVQGKLVGWLDVPEWIVMTSKGGSLRLGSASLSFSDFLWKGSPASASRVGLQPAAELIL